MMAQQEEDKKDDGLVIALGSGSAIKKKCVDDTFGGKATVIGLKFASGIPEQPVGKEQTKEGAEYRAKKAQEMKPDAMIWIGIENGMYREVPEDAKDASPFDYWFDVGCIVVMWKNEKNEVIQDCVWSETLAIPVESAEMCLTKDGKAAQNAGNLTWSPLKDPHRELTTGPKPRAVFLSETLQKWRASSTF